MKKRDLKTAIAELAQTIRWRNPKIALIEQARDDILERARAAETDRRLALELLVLARAILVPGSGETADKIAAFLKERGL